MQLEFHKLTATGNDFILFFGLKESLSFYSNLAKKVCDRHYGIGADGILVLNKYENFFLRYFNSDGSEAFCGNGTRAAAFWIKDKFKIKDDFFIKTIAGNILCRLVRDNILVEAPNLVTLKTVRLPKKAHFKNGFYVFAGAHHLVIITKSIDKIDVLKEGSFLRHSKIFKPHGVNVNFVEIVKKTKNFILSKIRTYEKGVEGETLSCASGATSSFYVINSLFKSSKVSFITRSGEKLTFNLIDGKPFINGSVNLICSGMFYY